MQRPDPSEIAPYFHPYIDRVPDGPVVAFLQAQGDRTAAFWESLSEEQAAHRYAPGKWSVKQVVGHLLDAERVMGYRALCFARSDSTDLPGFEEDDYVAAGGFDARTMQDLVAEYRAVRRATVAMVERFADEVSRRSGVANGNRMSVRSIVWLTAGHELHHLAVLAERYGLAASR